MSIDIVCVYLIKRDPFEYCISFVCILAVHREFNKKDTINGGMDF